MAWKCRACGQRSATANLDSPCARRPSTCAGRGEETGFKVEQRNWYEGSGECREIVLDFESPIQGREAGRLAGAAGDEIRTGHQPQNRQGPRPHRPGKAVGHRRRGNPMKRRQFIAGIGDTATWPLAARAQQAERIRRIAVLMGTSGDADDLEGPRHFTAFRQALQALGWTEGRNVRSGCPLGWPVDAGRMRTIVAEVVKQQPDAILVESAPASRCAHAGKPAGSQWFSSMLLIRLPAGLLRTHGSPRRLRSRGSFSNGAVVGGANGCRLLHDVAPRVSADWASCSIQRQHPMSDLSFDQLDAAVASYGLEMVAVPISQ